MSQDKFMIDTFGGKLKIAFWALLGRLYCRGVDKDEDGRLVVCEGFYKKDVFTLTKVFSKSEVE